MPTLLPAHCGANTPEYPAPDPLFCRPGPPCPPTIILKVPPALMFIVPSEYPPAPPLVFVSASAPPPGANT